MDELIDIVDAKTGEPTGETIYKSQAHKEGIWHRAIHILIVNKDRTKTLLQRRCDTKPLYPNMWDIAVGGHIGAGEDPLEAAKRELGEELGLDITEYEVEFVGKSQEDFNNNGVHSREWVSNYVLYGDINLENIKLQNSEVSAAGWFTKEELNEKIAEGTNSSCNRV